MAIDLAREERRVYTNNVRSRTDGLPATLTLEEWLAILERFQGMCAYCETVPFSLIEHIIPHFADGGTTADNCIPACKRCNSRKYDYLVDADLPYWDRIERIRTALHSEESIPRMWQPVRETKSDECITFVFKQEDQEAIMAIRQYYGVRSNADAIRIALRQSKNYLTSL